MAKKQVSKWEAYGLEDFLVSSPSMHIVEMNDFRLEIEGDYSFKASHDGQTEIEDYYELKIVFPSNYPRSIPSVYEEDKRIKRELDNHINLGGSFCLGSTLRVKQLIQEASSISSFCENTITPFLYSYSYKEKHNDYPYGELSHFSAGLVEDYEQLFELKGKKSVIQALRYLSANKLQRRRMACPCGCSKRAPSCEYTKKLEKWENIESKNWFKYHCKDVAKNR